MNGGHPDEVPLTADERRAIAALKRLAKRWPKSLWLFAGTGMNVMRCGSDGEHVTLPNGSMDQAYAVDQVNIDCDGGDW